MSVHSLSVLLLLRLLLVEAAQPLVHPQLLGCYSTDFVESNPYYRIPKTLILDEGFNACVRRLTMYIGISYVNGWRGENVIYCGNELGSHSRRVDESMCEPCRLRSNKQCGGNGTMSLYRLRSETPFALLMASVKSGVKMFSREYMTTDTLINAGDKVHDVDYIYNHDQLFFSNGSKVYRSNYDYDLTSYKSTEDIKNVSVGDIEVEEFAVDWVNNQIFWSHFEATPKDYKLFQTDLESLKANLIATHFGKLRDMAVDPYSRLLFAAEDPGVMFIVSLENNFVTRFSLYGTLNITDIWHFTVDIEEQLLYVVGRVDIWSKYQLFRVDYEGKNLEVLYGGPELSLLTSLDVYKGVAVWVYVESDYHTIYKCRLNPKCEQKNIQIVHRSGEATHDVKIYHPERQTPSLKYLCDKLKCSQYCQRDSLFVAKCTSTLETTTLQTYDQGEDDVAEVQKDAQKTAVSHSTKSQDQGSSGSSFYLYFSIIFIFVVLFVSALYVVPKLLVFFKSRNNHTIFRSLVNNEEETVEC